MSPAADAADRLVDDPVARGARTAPATPTSRLLTSPGPQREKDKKEKDKKEMAAGAAGAAAVGRRHASRARGKSRGGRLTAPQFPLMSPRDDLFLPPTLRVAFGTALVARLRQGIKREGD